MNDLLESLPSIAYNYPHIFKTDEDSKREANKQKRELKAKLVNAESVVIKPDSSFSVFYKNGDYMGTRNRIGYPNTYGLLEAINESGVKVVVERNNQEPVTL